jgi:hypothetical protein
MNTTALKVPTIQITEVTRLKKQLGNVIQIEIAKRKYFAGKNH